MQPTPEELDAHLDKFTDIRDQEAPKDQLLTIYCDDGTIDVGFAYNTYFGDLGIDQLIAKKWILQTELDQLLDGNSGKNKG